MVIAGNRTGRPSKRLTLQLDNFKVHDAKIIHTNKNKITEHQITRINHLPTRQEIRLHTAQLQYPGEYQLEIAYSGVAENEIQNLKIDQLTSTTLSSK